MYRRDLSKSIAEFSDLPRLERYQTGRNGKKAVGVSLGNGLQGRGEI